jgi:hypothetical protein
LSRTVLGSAVLVLLAANAAVARDPAAKAVYCTWGENGQWSLHRFKPLIKVQGGTVFAEMVFDGAVLEEVRLRRFYADSELAFEYAFDRSGALAVLRGVVTVKSEPPPGAEPGAVLELADWVGEADITPGSDGKIPPHHVWYSREKDRIDKPDNADKYVGRFNDAPVYRTIENVPCAALMKEAEKMNATQE